jgi:hypothetical protein
MDGAVVFCTVKGARLVDVAHLEPLCTFVEAEGLTVVVSAEKALQQKWEHSNRFSQITLEVHSSLDAVGLTAAVSSALAAAGISANIVAGFFHDHVFVQEDRAEDAVEVLVKLGEEAQVAARS